MDSQSTIRSLRKRLTKWSVALWKPLLLNLKLSSENFLDWLYKIIVVNVCRNFGHGDLVNFEIKYWKNCNILVKRNFFNDGWARSSGLFLVCFSFLQNEAIAKLFFWDAFHGAYIDGTLMLLRGHKIWHYLKISPELMNAMLILTVFQNLSYNVTVIEADK